MNKFSMVLLAAFLVALTACDSFVEVHGRFAVYNRSPDPAILIVNAVEYGPVIEPNQASPMTVEVPIPLQRGYGTTGPTDEVVSVSVSFKNLRTGRLSRVETCQAGAKVVTNVTYNSDDSWGAPNEWVDCRSSY